MSGGRAWTKADEVDLKMYIGLGYSHQHIGPLMDRSHFAIARKVVDLGIQRQPRPRGSYNKALRNECLRLKAKMSASQIAAYLGISRNAVIGHWYRATLP